MTANGIKISEAKSIISRKDDRHQTGEVAKRLILDGKEISPPTPKLIYKTFRDWRLAPMLLEDMVRRGWELRTDTLLEVLYNLYSKRWADYIITVLSFPFTNGTSALYFKEVTKSCSKWKEQEISELAINFVRYRIHLLDKAGSKAMGSVSIDDTTMLKVLMRAPLDETDPAIYSLGPLPNIRSEMSMKMARTNRRLVECVKEISNIDSETIVVPSIQDEELYYPDYSLQFLETKYRRQQFYSNTLITFKRHIDNGTLQNILKDAGGILL
jgi:hypothetical protein